MIKAFALTDDGQRLIRIDNKKQQNLNNAIWLDLVNPTDVERSILETGLSQKLSDDLDVDDLESSARFFEDENGLHLHTFFYCLDDEGYADMESVAFTIRDGRLFTLRERELTAFRLYRMRTKIHKLVSANSYELLLDLLDTKVEQLADIIEEVYGELEDLSRLILKDSNGEEIDDALSDLTEYEDTSSKVRLCLMDTQRALNFLIRKASLPTKQLEQAREIMRDIESLTPHNEAVFQKVDFLMQAAMGFINIEQNRIIKLFSVVSVMFLPPTLVASIYGMNFGHMPELNFTYGYPMALVVMLLVAIAPFWYFKYKKWL